MKIKEFRNEVTDIVEKQIEKESDCRSSKMTGMVARVSSGVLPAMLLLLLLLLLPAGEAIWLNLPSTGTKCVSEEIQNNVVVLADYIVISDDQNRPSPTISVKVH